MHDSQHCKNPCPRWRPFCVWDAYFSGLEAMVRINPYLARSLLLATEYGSAMTQSTDIDRQARQLMKALKPTLRRHLGAEGLKKPSVTGLYWRLRQSLVDSGGLASESSEQESDLQRLALDVYLTAATHLEGSEATPDLLSSVRREIERVVSDLSTTQGKATQKENPA